MIKIDHNRISKAVTSAFDATIDRLSDEFDNAITADVWQWSGVTVRRNGDIVSSPRDIVDEGSLLGSQVILRRGYSAVYVWEAPHALKVHEGATFQDGREYSARPWTKYALQQFDAAKYMQMKLNKELVK